MQKDMANSYDPNSHIDPEIRDRAKIHSRFPFDQARVPVHEVDTGAPNSFIVGRAGNRLHLVYVRVTFEDDQEEGAGPMPGMLIDMAKEMDAEPHIVRVHYRKQGGGTGIEYYGHDELERILKSGDHWRRALVGKRTVRKYLALTKGRMSKLEVEVVCRQPGDPPWTVPNVYEIISPEEKELRKILGEENYDWDAAKRNYPGDVFLRLRVDTFLPGLENRTISIGALAASAIDSDEHFIFTCSCGTPGCAGIWRGVEVVHEDGLVVWRDRGVRPMRIAVFDQKEYRREILKKVRQALALHKEMGPEASFGASDRREMVENVLCSAVDDENG